MKLIKGAKLGSVRPIDLTGYADIVNRNIKERERQRIIRETHEKARQLREQAAEYTKPINIAKGTAQTLFQGLKQIGKYAIGTGLATIADIGNVFTDPLLGKRKESIKVFGEEYKTPSSMAITAGEFYKRGEKKKAAGMLGEAAVDVVSTFYSPFKGLKFFRNGKIINGILEGATTTGIYSTAYGLAQGLKENKDTKGIIAQGLKSGITGTAVGSLLAGSTGLLGKAFQRKATFKETPKELINVIGKRKPLEDFVASRPNLVIDKVKTLGKDLEGNKIQSRLEWDYRNNKGYMLFTPEATDINLAHETAHYIEKVYPEVITKYSDEIKKVSGGKQNINEDFAYTFTEILYNEEARKKAPNLTRDIEEVFKIELPQLKSKENVRAVSEKPAEVSQSPTLSKQTNVNDVIPNSTKQIKEKLSETPTAIRNLAKQTYNKELKSGATKQQAIDKAIKKVDLYETKVAKIAKDVPIIKQLREARKRQGPTPRKKVKTEGLNWSTINTSKETENILRTIFEENKQFKQVRPSRTNKDIIEGARAVGIDVNNKAELDRILAEMPTANTALKLKQAMVDSASDLMNYLKTIDTGNMTAEETKKVVDKFLRTQAIAKTFSGLRTEASHLLRSMGIETREAENLAELAVKLKGILGESANELDFINKTQKLIKQDFLDFSLSVWYNSILSGWKTWTRNILDTTNSLIAETFSKTANPTTILEVPRFVAGLVKSFPSSLNKAVKVLLGKEKFSSRLEYSTEVIPYIKNKKLNLLLTETSGRVLSSQDVVFHNTTKLALDTIDAFHTKIKKLDIPQEIAVTVNDAMNAWLADRITYRNKPLGNIGVVTSSLSNITTKIKPLKVIIPFIKVVGNTVDRKIDYMPILNIARTFGKKYLQEEARVILKSTNIPPKYYDKLIPVMIQRLRQQQLGRFYFGILFTTAAYALAANDRLSGGGPQNVNEMKQLMDTGWRRYSIRIGDKWIPYTYLGPLAGILAAAGSINDAIKYNRKGEQVTKVVANGLIGFSRNLMTTSFLQGIADLFDVLSGKGKTPEDYLRDLVVGLVPIPAMWTQTTQALDGKSYDIKTYTEAIQWKLGITKNLTPRLNALGEEIRADLIYGITPAKERKELQAKFQARGLKVNVPAKTTKLGDRKMTRKELFEYTKLRGEKIKARADYILKIVDKQKTQEAKERVFQSYIEKLGLQAKEEMKRRQR